jgi:hypothetical protein
LKSKLESLYSDEGIKIKSKKDQIEVFVNKKAHGSNIVEILNKNSSTAEGAKDDDIKLFSGLANGIRQRII